MDRNKEIKKIKPDNREVSKYDFIICPNCGAEEVGKFCPNCGQSNKDFNKPIKEIGADLLDSINLDIRLINTLVPFFFRPGQLAEDYFKGKRRRYVPPMRMYILFSVLFFFLAKFADIEKLDDVGKISNGPSADSINHEVAMALTDVENNLRTELEQNEIPFDTTYLEYAENLKDSAGWFKKNLKVKTKEQDTSNKSFGDLSPEEIQEIKDEIALDSTISKSTKDIIRGGLNIADKKDVFWEKFLNNSSYVLFILMPFFALILAMTLFRSKKLYVHHLIFSINYHSFIFAFSSVIILVSMVLPDNIMQHGGYLFFIYPLYLMFGIKKYYNRSYVGAFFKTIGISLLYYFVIFIAIIAIMAFTAKGFAEG
ncbi:MAG: hypothetical protein C0597_11775 [Marinilabiliales bacterium]|nr:MAG: hypothetical protein C0597_11775 [Marinilabiliales bacterium]